MSTRNPRVCCPLCGSEMGSNHLPRHLPTHDPAHIEELRIRKNAHKREIDRANRDVVNAKQLARYRAQHPPRGVRECPRCGAGFDGRRDKRFCSKACGRALRKSPEVRVALLGEEIRPNHLPPEWRPVLEAIRQTRRLIRQRRRHDNIQATSDSW